MKIQLTIPGKPVAKQRARIFKNKYTGKIMPYTPKETTSYANLIKTIYINKYGQHKLNGALRQTIIAYYPMPKSTSKKKRILMLEDKIRPTKKPDYDNVEKIFSDSLEGIAFDNDNQIVSSKFDKYYSDNSRVEIELKQLEEE